VTEIKESGKLGIQAEITHMDFPAIMRRMKEAVESGRSSIMEAIKDSEHLDFHHGEGHFVRDHTLEVNGEKIKGKKIFIAAGARPIIPPIKGLESVEFLNNENILELGKSPESLLIIGGGYVAVEYGHFFAAMGTKVTMVQRNERLLPNEEPEVSDLLTKEMGKRMEIHTNAEVVELTQGVDGCTAVTADRSTGARRHITTERIMVATGRRSNADLLRVEHTGVETDGASFINVNDQLETNKRNIWALGDIIGKQMFTHAGDREAEVAWHNAAHKKKMKMDFSAVPHAVFTHPQIASIGLTEEQARKEHEILVGKAKYADTVMGTAMMEEEGFAKAVVDKNTKKILGFHIIGPEASLLIQEVVNVVAHQSDISYITNSMHIFPALSELIPQTLNNLK
jgi:dihydrolipoamide dehydrogenase